MEAQLCFIAKVASKLFCVEFFQIPLLHSENSQTTIPEHGEMSLWCRQTTMMPLRHFVHSNFIYLLETPRTFSSAVSEICHWS